MRLRLDVQPLTNEPRARRREYLRCKENRDMLFHLLVRDLLELFEDLGLRGAAHFRPA